MSSLRFWVNQKLSYPFVSYRWYKLYAEHIRRVTFPL